MGTMLTRRDLAKQAMRCGGAMLVGFEEAAWPMLRLPRLQTRPDDPFSGGKQLGTVDFLHLRPLEMDAAQGTELDGRLYTDLSKLSLQEPVTPTEKFYIRDRKSTRLNSSHGYISYAVFCLKKKKNNFTPFIAHVTMLTSDELEST